MGAVLSYVSMGINILIQFAYVPLLLHFLSKNEYGLYQLIGSLIAYMAVMDFGLSTTIVRYYSKYKALKDKQGEENILAIFSTIYAIITLGCVLIGIALYFTIDSVYGNTLSITEMYSAKIMFLILLGNIAITLPANIFTAVITVHERFVFLRLVAILQTCLKPLVVISVFAYEASAINLVIINTVFNLFVISCNIYYCYKKLNLKIKFHYWDKMLVKEVLAFSFFIFLNAIVDQIYWKTSQLVLGAVIGTAAVAIYAIAIQLDMAFMNFSTGISGVFLPKLSAIVATTKNMTAIDDLFIKIGRIQYLILALICSGFLVYGKQFIVLWAGESFEESYYIAAIIMVALIIPLIQNLGISIMQAMNKHAFRAKIYVIIALLNFAISIPLAHKYGGIGCAIATSGALLLGNGLLINIYYYKVIHLDIFRFFKEILKLTIPVLIVVFISLILEKFVTNVSIPILVGKITMYSILYGIVLWKFGMNKYEKSLIAGLVHGKL